MGVAKGFKLQLGSWVDIETIMVIPLDDYDFMVRLKFLEWVNALLIPFVDCMCILDPHYQYVMPIKRDKGVEAKVYWQSSLIKRYVGMKFHT